MIWRLMASVLVMSDTGSVSLVSDATDWPDQPACMQVLQSHYQPPPPQTVEGHRITMKISASCVPVGDAIDPPMAAPRGLPPPLAQILPRIFPGAPCMGTLGPCEISQ